MLQSPYLFGTLVVLLAALVVWGLQHTVEPEREEANRKLFFKFLIAGIASVFLIGYFMYRPDPLLTDAFPDQ